MVNMSLQCTGYNYVLNVLYMYYHLELALLGDITNWPYYLRWALRCYARTTWETHGEIAWLCIEGNTILQFEVRTKGSPPEFPASSAGPAWERMPQGPTPLIVYSEAHHPPRSHKREAVLCEGDQSRFTARGFSTKGCATVTTGVDQELSLSHSVI